MKRFIGYIPVLAVACTLSCNHGSGTSAPVPPSFSGKALLVQTAALEQLLAIGTVAGFVGVPAEQLTVHIEDYEERPDRKKLAYHWPVAGDGIMFTTIDGEDVSIPRHHSVGIANIRVMDRQTFERLHTTSAGLKEAIAEIAKDESVDADIALAQTNYLASLASSMSLETLKGVGEAAVWELPTQQLHVYADGVAFTITANFGDDAKANKRQAIAFTRLVLDGELRIEN